MRPGARASMAVRSRGVIAAMNTSTGLAYRLMPLHRFVSLQNNFETLSHLRRWICWQGLSIRCGVADLNNITMPIPECGMQRMP